MRWASNFLFLHQVLPVVFTEKTCFCGVFLGFQLAVYVWVGHEALGSVVQICFGGVCVCARIVVF